MPKRGFFGIDRNFWYKNFFGEKYISLQCFPKFLAEIGHSGHYFPATFLKKLIFSKNDLNLEGKIGDRQKFLTKKISEISAPKKTIFEKYIYYVLFFTFWRMPGFVGAIAALTTTWNGIFSSSFIFNSAFKFFEEKYLW